MSRAGRATGGAKARHVAAIPGKVVGRIIVGIEWCFFVRPMR